jgi:hypothetical protein
MITQREMENSIRDQLIDIILKVAMAHHDDISKSDEDAACDAADEIIKKFPRILPIKQGHDVGEFYKE